MMASEQEINGWRVGQHCQVREFPGSFEIAKLSQFEGFAQAQVYKLNRQGGRSKYNSSVDIDRLMPIGAPQPAIDKEGRSAAEYARELFASGFAFSDLCRTDCEAIVQVLGISKTGRVKVQSVYSASGVRPKVERVLENGQKIYSQEIRIVNWAALDLKLHGQPQTYSPRLHDGKWTFWQGEKYLKRPGMTLTHLLD